eukprot:2412879-Prymnesium_polylepis.1
MLCKLHGQIDAATEGEALAERFKRSLLLNKQLATAAGDDGLCNVAMGDFDVCERVVEGVH